MTRQVVVGVDIGTSSAKGVLVDRDDGAILASATREHTVERPRAGWVEADARTWLDELASIAAELLTDARDVEVVAVGVSGMGPCVLLTDADGDPVRPAILYGVDTRAGEQIEALDAELGSDAVRERCGSTLTSQAAGPKLRWVADREPEAWARTERWFMPSSYLAHDLTGAYVLDHHSASQSTPLYDTHAQDWYAPWAERVAPGLELPRLVWPGDVVGAVTDEAAARTGLPAGAPVVAGTIDAWSEAVSVGAQRVDDLMLMYGTTMFLVNTVDRPLTSPTMWGTVGAFPGTRNLAGGMATSGAITTWLRDLTGGDYAALTEQARASGPGARGLLVLPYFAGERTPVQDPRARGLVAGLTLSHGAGDLYRAALEATALGVRHNVEAMQEAGGKVGRVVPVGGGVQGGLWTQIVSDVTGLAQEVPTRTFGASYGAAFLAAAATGDADVDAWNPTASVCEPDPSTREQYEELYGLYREAYPATRDLAHALARRQEAADDHP